MKKRQRLYFVCFVFACLALAAGIALYALKDYTSYFHTPSRVMELRAMHSRAVAPSQGFHLGGLVEEGSIRREGASVSFTVTDGAGDVPVVYNGILPDLFREGQGVVAIGALREDGVFEAREILAKHDENYRPPGLEKAAE